eukprot:2330778-Amphidinium_carterae.1
MTCALTNTSRGGDMGHKPCHESATTLSYLSIVVSMPVFTLIHTYHAWQPGGRQFTDALKALATAPDLCALALLTAH